MLYDTYPRERIPPYQNKIKNGKDLKEYAKTLKDEQPIGVIIVNENLVKNENCDGYVTEGHLRFSGKKLSKPQLEMIMENIGSHDLRYNFNLDTIEDIVNKVKKENPWHLK